MMAQSQIWKSVIHNCNFSATSCLGYINCIYYTGMNIITTKNNGYNEQQILKELTENCSNVQ